MPASDQPQHLRVATQGNPDLDATLEPTVQPGTGPAGGNAAKTPQHLRLTADGIYEPTVQPGTGPDGTLKVK